MNENGVNTIDLPDDAVEQALTDHHLDEVARMIEEAQPDQPSSDRPLTNSPPSSAVA